MDPPPFLLWPGFRGSIRERVSLRDKGARARGVGRRWGCVQASERWPGRPDARLRQGIAKNSTGKCGPRSSRTDADCLSRTALPTGSLGGL